MLNTILECSTTWPYGSLRLRHHYANTWKTLKSNTLGHKAAQCIPTLSEFSCMHLPYSSWYPKPLGALTNQGLQHCFVPCASIAVSIMYCNWKICFAAGNPATKLPFKLCEKSLQNSFPGGYPNPLKNNGLVRVKYGCSTGLENPGFWPKPGVSTTK